MKVKQVFGEPYERDGITVIPAAAVSGGGGGGGDASEAGGAGFGLSARPVGLSSSVMARSAGRRPWT